MEIEIINSKMETHVSFTDGGQLTHSGEIKCKGHILNGRKIFRIIWTPRISEFEWGKGELIWKSEVNPKKEYKTINGLLRSLGLPLLKKKKDS